MDSAYLKCSSCGKVDAPDAFTRGNRSQGGTVGRCKECKAGVDAEYRAKKESTALKWFDLQPDMLERHRPRVGVLMLHRLVDRQIGKASRKGFFLESNFGLKSILSELNEPYEICYPETINQYQYILISLSSVMDIENLIYTFERFCPENVTPTVIAGGFGVINIRLIKRHIDVAVFGRAEGQINAILSGYNYSNVWRKRDDPDITQAYSLRQPKYLLPGEVSVGCLHRCAFCQYAHTRMPIGKASQYHPGEGIKSIETDWNSLVISEAGFYTTAWDGWSERTRMLVNKKITNEQITNKLISVGIDKGIASTVSLKIFMIVGYPHETVDSVMRDIDQVVGMLADIDKQIKNKIVISFLCTPFGPEPLTPMQYDRANIDVNWNELLAGRKLYYGQNIKSYITTSVSGPFALLKRVMINRSTERDYELFTRIAFNKRLRQMPERHKIGWLKKHGGIDFGLFGDVESAGFDYLRTVCKGGAKNHPSLSR